MDLSELPSELINRIESFKSDSRKAEVITTHFLLEKATGSKHIVHYDAFNKPYLKGNPLSLSISHSSHYAAVFLSVTSCGVDVETISSRASKIAHKFVHDSERLLISGYTENQADTIIWSVKEAVYKISGQPDFKSSILIRSDIRPDKEMLHVDIINRNNTQKIKVFYRIFEDQVIAWTHEDISI
jgi:phosphopantetheinyl transferase